MGVVVLSHTQIPDNSPDSKEKVGFSTNSVGAPRIQKKQTLPPNKNCDKKLEGMFQLWACVTHWQFQTETRCILAKLQCSRFQISHQWVVVSQFCGPSRIWLQFARGGSFQYKCKYTPSVVIKNCKTSCEPPELNTTTLSATYSSQLDWTFFRAQSQFYSVSTDTSNSSAVWRCLKLNFFWVWICSITIF